MTGDGTVIATIPAAAAQRPVTLIDNQASSSTDNMVDFVLNVPPVATNLSQTLAAATVGVGDMVLLDDMDAVTGMSSVMAALMNIGPGFGDVGPSENFAWISDAGKWFLSWNMLVGRLEMFSALVIFYPSFWRR